jgi:hypothetical protein
MSHREYEGKITRGDIVYKGTLDHSGGQDYAEVSIWRITASGLEWVETIDHYGNGSWEFLKSYGFR